MIYNDSIKLSENYKNIKFDYFSLYYFANDSLINEFINKINIFDIQKITFENINQIIKSLDGLFSIILDCNQFIFIVSDCIASRPLFYRLKDSTIIISDTPRILISKTKNINQKTVEYYEFKYSGYVCGNKTLFKEIKQIQPAEILYYNKNDNKISENRYFIYYPIKNCIIDKSNKLKELDDILNNIFNRIINDSDNNQIVIPLSGGLDSRLILAKFHELGCSNLLTFSYGDKESHEVIKAKMFAKILDVEWIHIDNKEVDMRSIFNSKQRQQYFDYSDGLRVVPTMIDYFSIKYLYDENIINNDSIIVNGQSGDFTTGNHIPKEIYKEEPTIEKITDIIYRNHFSIFLNKNETYNKKIKSNISDILEKIYSLYPNDYNPSSLYESWEWQERQSKYVVNGQRLYEFFGLKWELPLWEPSFTQFWNKIPNHERYTQNLYKDYLYRYDYKTLFTNQTNQVKGKTFPGFLSGLVFIIDQLTKKIFGERYRGLKYFSYFSHYSHIYKYFSFKFFLKNINKIKCPPQARGFIGLLIIQWITENIHKQND